MSYEKYEDHEDTSDELSSMWSKLSAVDTAINKLKAKAKGNNSFIDNSSLTARSLTTQSPISASTSIDIPSSHVTSQLIDTTIRQMGCCPNCYLEMPLALLRHHMANNCTTNDMKCPEVGCNASFSRHELKRHLAKECRIAKHRRFLIQQAQIRKEEKKLEAIESAKSASTAAPFYSHYDDYDDSTYPIHDSHCSDPGPEAAQFPVFTCTLCQESMPFSKSVSHSDSCKCRVIYCPNRVYGCDMEVAFLDLVSHLHDHCSVEKRKSQLIARSNKRKELVRCVGCGDYFPLRDLKLHEVESCPNRKVACCNAHLGCQVIMRASLRKAHEQVDNAKARIRYCLYFAGTGAHIALQEDDVVPPWTTEYWMYRPSARESSKQYMRASLLLIPSFIDAFMIENQAKDYVDSITVLLSDKTITYTLEEREDAMELLAQAVELLEDSAVAAVAASKALGCAIGGAQNCMSEFMGISQRKFEFAYPTPDLPYSMPASTIPSSGQPIEKVSLRIQAPGEASLDRTKEMPASDRENRAASRKNAKGASRGGSRDGASLSRHNDLNADMAQSNVISTDIVPIADSANLDEAAAHINESLALAELEYVNAQLGEDIAAMAVDDSLQHSASEATVPLPGNVIMDVESPVVMVDSSESVQLQSPTPSLEAIAVSQADEKLHPQTEQIPLLPWTRPSSALKKSAIAELLSLPSTFSPSNTYNIPATATPYTPYMNTRHGCDTAINYDPSTVPVPALFLLQALVRGRRGGAGQGVISSPGYHMLLSWPEWWSVSVLLADALWDDKKTLQSLEQESGLLGKQKKEKTPIDAAVAINAPGKGKEDDAMRLAQEEADNKALKKEKARLRKEAKMKKGQQQTMDDEEEAALANNEDLKVNPAGQDDEMAAADEKAEKVEADRMAKKDAREKSRQARKNLKDRLIEIDRGSNGVDLLGFSSILPSSKTTGLINKICLDMTTGPLSWKPKIDAETPAYLLKKIQKKSKKIDKEDAASPMMDSRDNALPGKMGVVLAECPAGGPGCFSFPCTVPRESWCHVALVAAPEPNRLVLYIDGMLKGTLKDCAIPLPMGAICAPSPLSLSAAFLDIRFWTKVRSQLEIQFCMSRLIKLEPPPLAATKDLKQKKLTAKERRDAQGKAPPPVLSSTVSAIPGQPDLTDRGLMAWFPFEDGACAARVLDVTEHRFPSPLSRNILAPLLPPPKVPSTGFVDAGSRSGEGIRSGNRVSISREVVMDSRRDDMPIVVPPRSPSRQVGSDYDIVKADLPFPDATPPPSRSVDTPSFRSQTPLSSSIRRATPSGAPKLPVYKLTPWLWMDADSIPLPNAMPLLPGQTDRPLPVPAFSSRGVCPYELKRLRLAQRGRQLYKEINCPLGCGEIIIRKDTKFHVAYECAQRTVTCRHFPICSATYPFSQRELHESIGSGALCLYIMTRQEHWSKSEYFNELINCEACSEEVRRRSMDLHLKRTCPHRMVSCPQTNCGQLLQFHMIQYHLQVDCRYALEKAFLVQRARLRSGYARPWAVEISFVAVDDMDALTNSSHTDYDAVDDILLLSKQSEVKSQISVSIDPQTSNQTLKSLRQRDIERDAQARKINPKLAFQIDVNDSEDDL